MSVALPPALWFKRHYNIALFLVESVIVRMLFKLKPKVEKQTTKYFWNLEPVSKYNDRWNILYVTK